MDAVDKPGEHLKRPLKSNGKPADISSAFRIGLECAAVMVRCFAYRVRLIVMFFVWVKLSSIAAKENSRPKPLCL